MEKIVHEYMLTIKQQRILFLLSDNKNLTRKEQDIYSSHSFYEKMAILKHMKLINNKPVISVNGKGFKPCEYFLTRRGMVLVKILKGENWL